jgi:hypothetical protein
MPRQTKEKPDQVPRGPIPYDLRRTTIPRINAPPAPGQQRNDTYVPRRTTEAVAAIRNEAKKRGILKVPGPLPAKKASSASTPLPRQQTKSRSRSRSISRQPPATSNKRVRIIEKEAASAPLIISGVIRPPVASSSAASSSAAEEEEGEEGEEEEEEEDNIGAVEDREEEEESDDSSLPVLSSETEALANALYTAKERYKAAIHRKRIKKAHQQYPGLQPSDIETSELEDHLGDAMRVADFLIQTCICLQGNNRLISHQVVQQDFTRRTFDILIVEQAVVGLINRHIGPCEWSIIKISVSFKQETGRGGTKHHDIDQFSIPAAEEVLQMVEDFRNTFTRSTPRMVWTWEIHIRYTQEKAGPTHEPDQGEDQEPSSPIPSSLPLPDRSRSRSAGTGGRRTRTTMLVEQNKARVKAIRNAGYFQRQLMERWRCNDDNYTNRHNFCFPDLDDKIKHYNITAPQHDSWANAISRGEATLVNPPLKLWNYWRNSGSISRESREPAKKTAAILQREKMDMLLEMQNKSFDLMMQQRMMDSMEAMEEKQERREERNERRQVQRDMRERELSTMTYQAPQRPINPLLNPASSPELLVKPYPLTPGPQNTMNYTAESLTPTPRASEINQTSFLAFQSRTSSPIDAAEEDAEILILFFAWKLQNTRNPSRKIKWEQARDIILNNDWSIRDLRLMEDGQSAMYHRAIKAGISDGFARSFREELQSFKEVYRRQRGEKEAEAIQVLNLLNSAV